MLTNPTPEDIRQFVEEQVAKAGTTDEKRATALGTTRPTLDRWRAAGMALKLSVLEELAKATGEPITIRFDPNTEREAPRPEWAGGLETRIAVEVARQLVDPKTRTALRELVRRTTETPPPSGGAVPEDASTQDLVE